MCRADELNVWHARMLLFAVNGGGGGWRKGKGISTKTEETIRALGRKSRHARDALVGGREGGEINI
jgi:hypothetical protein